MQHTNEAQKLHLMAEENLFINSNRSKEKTPKNFIQNAKS